MTQERADPLYTHLMSPGARDFTHGFLPPEEPLTRLSEPFIDWEQTGAVLPKLALSRHIRPVVEELPPFPLHRLETLAEHERAMCLLSFLANMYVFAPDHPVAGAIPRNLALAWHSVACRLGRPPMLTYASQVMYNWRRVDRRGSVEVGNLHMIQNFLGGMDEEWFVTIHVHIEAVAGRALALLIPGQEAVSRREAETVVRCLESVTETLHEMRTILERMPERCDPNTYYHRIRPYMFGWKNNPELPDGMVYTGVEAYGNRPRQFRGETGAQSAVIYAVDGFLGIEHGYDEMRAYLMEMRDYMPVQDRHFVETVERGPSARQLALERGNDLPGLRNAYNAAVEALYEFRKLHIEYAALYVLKPGQRENKGHVGTGGTPFTVYLKKHIDETLAHRIQPPVAKTVAPTDSPC